VVIAVGLAGCGSSGSSSTHTAASTATTPAAQTQTQTSTQSQSTTAASSSHGCTSVPAPAPKAAPHLSAPQIKLDPAKTYTVTVATNCGTFAFTLDVKDAPKTSASVYSLVKRGFYDGLTFHRVAAGFVIQGGDPTGTGGGGPGYTVVEAPPQNTRYILGTVAMAKTATQPAGASGSQFFIVTGKNAGLPPDYAVAGKVVSGLDAVERIGALSTNPPGDGMPVHPVVMSKVTVAER
jgi:cyclophilin family peptidyl-prolyl cis-trans isomerase